jgi:hypothetical protein
MQRMSIRNQESWICSKIYFIELFMSMIIFSYSKYVKF